jgi:hypothetical protein
MCVRQSGNKGYIGPKVAKAVKRWEKLRDEYLHKWFPTEYFRVIKFRNIKGAGYVAHIGEKRNLYRVVVGKRQGKRQVGISSRR